MKEDSNSSTRCLLLSIAKGMAELDAGLGEELTYDVVADVKRIGRIRAADGDQ